MLKPLTFLLNGKRWQFLRTRITEKMPDGSRIYGRCSPPDARPKKVEVDDRIKGELELDTVIHELLHASAWDVLDEGFVDGTASGIARVLWRIGYRKVDLHSTQES